MTSDDPLTIALGCAARGWHVFPCNAKKQPLTKNGFKDATTDLEKVRYFWEKKPQALIGIATGASGLVVVDVDTGKGDVDGYDGWRDIVRQCGDDLEMTTQVETPSHGLHLYYRANGHKVSNSASKLAPGVDVRAEGGYVIAAGSPGYLYVDGHGPELLTGLPPLLSKRLAYAKTPAPLIPEAAFIIPEGRRDNSLLEMGGAMRRKGMSEEAIRAALAAENKAHCKPPLPDKDVARIAKSVSRYEPSDPVAVKPAPHELFIDWTTFWKRERSEEEWVYPDVLARGRGHAIYATHKAGKSLFMLYMAAKIATGPTKTVVVYLDYEMTEGDVHDRLEDMGYGAHTDFSFLRYALLPTLRPLDTIGGADDLMALLRSVAEEWPGYHMVVIIDTISRAVKGKENDADTFRDFYSHTGIRLKRLGCTWARMDHGGKDPGQGQRGSSGKGDDVDVVWKLTKTQNGIKLRRELARMGWVPEEVTLGIADDPLCYERMACDWPEGTVELATLLNRLGVPLESSANKALEKLRPVGEGRHKKAVLKALSWRKEQAVKGLLNRFPNAREPLAGNGGSEKAGTTVDSEAGTAPGTTGNHPPEHDWEPGGVTSREPPVPAPPEPLDLGDMP